jgi:arginine exporter protein ArgO
MVLPAMLLKGLALGVAIAAPVGPIGLLCMQRTLRQGRLAGLASADALHAAAGFAMAALSAFMTRHRAGLQLVSGLVFMVLGLRSLWSRPQRGPAAARSGGLVTDYLSMLLLTLANPQTTLSFIAAFAALGLAAPDGGTGQAGPLVLGVFLGSAGWWLVLSSGGGWLRTISARGAPPRSAESPAGFWSRSVARRCSSCSCSDVGAASFPGEGDRRPLTPEAPLHDDAGGIIPDHLPELARDLVFLGVDRAAREQQRLVAGGSDPRLEQLAGLGVHERRGAQDRGRERRLARHGHGRGFDPAGAALDDQTVALRPRADLEALAIVQGHVVEPDQAVALPDLAIVGLALESSEAQQLDREVRGMLDHHHAGLMTDDDLMLADVAEDLVVDAVTVGAGRGLEPERACVGAQTKADDQAGDAHG